MVTKDSVHKLPSDDQTIIFSCQHLLGTIHVVFYVPSTYGYALQVSGVIKLILEATMNSILSLIVEL